MVNNPYVNKVISNNQTLIDLTADTVAPADVRAGVTFHDMSGAACVGTGAGGKTIASISPTSVPVAWSSVVATYELVSRDFDVASGNGSKITRSYAVTFIDEQYSLNPDDYFIKIALPKRSNDILDYGSGPRMFVMAPSGEIQDTYFLTPTTTQGTASSDDDAAWIGAASKEPLATSARLYYPDYRLMPPNDGEDVVAPAVALRSIENNGDGTYTLTFDDGTTATSSTYSGDIISDSTGNECIISCKCINVTGTASRYNTGYLVTYTDDSTETFLAYSSDVANGRY